MAEKDLYAIEVELAKILRNDAGLKQPKSGNQDVTVEVEVDLQMYADKCPWVGIYLDEWSPDLELLTGLVGKPYIIFYEIQLFIVEFAMENEKACELRNRLFTHVKEVIKKNRTINGRVLETTFLGGDFQTALDSEGSFYKSATINLRVQVRE